MSIRIIARERSLQFNSTRRIAVKHSGRALHGVMNIGSRAGQAPVPELAITRWKVLDR
jgi:hypothetical protein